MNHFSIQTIRAKEIAEQQKNMAIEMSSVSEKVYLLLNHSKISSVLNYSQRTTLSNAQEAVSAQQLQMARLSAALYESAVEYENADKGSMQTLSSTGETITQTDLEAYVKALTDNYTRNGLGRYTNEIISAFGDIKAFYESDIPTDEKIIQGFEKFKDVAIKPYDYVKNFIEWKRQTKFKEPDGLKGAMDLIDTVDDGINLYTAMKNYVVGDVTNNPELQAEGAAGYIDSLKGMVKGTKSVKKFLEGYGFSPINPGGLLVDYLFAMPKNWGKAIVKEDATVQEVYFQTFGTSALEVVLAPIEMINKIPAAFGVDSGGELYDIIKENCTWENWKSGMKILFGKK